MGLIKSLWRGEKPLWQSFWIYGFLGLILLSLLMSAFITSALAGYTRYGYLSVPAILLIYLVYTVFISVAIWRSAGRYAGARSWSLGARILVLLNLAALLYSLVHTLSVFTTTGVRFDPGEPELFNSEVNSTTIYTQLSYDPDYPLVGFWSKDCTSGYGLAIDMKADGLYQVFPCNRDNCRNYEHPLHQRINTDDVTNLIDSPKYRVIDNDHIEVGRIHIPDPQDYANADAKTRSSLLTTRQYNNFETYSRCQPIRDN